MSDVARILKEARDQGRLTALDFAQGIFDDFIELHGDRNFRDDGAIIGGIGRLNGQAVTVVGIQKGRNLQDNLNRNFAFTFLVSSQDLVSNKGTPQSNCR